MTGFEDWVTWLYGNGDLIMVICRIVVFLFVLEIGSYIVSLISGVAKSCFR
jgi:hypothetical protein